MSRLVYEIELVCTSEVLLRYSRGLIDIISQENRGFDTQPPYQTHPITWLNSVAMWKVDHSTWLAVIYHLSLRDLVGLPHSRRSLEACRKILAGYVPFYGTFGKMS
jgi:hypothetical protein